MFIYIKADQNKNIINIKNKIKKMNNKIKIITLLSITLLTLSGCAKKNDNKSQENLPIEDQTVTDENELAQAFSLYSLEDEDLETTVGGDYVICRTDENCITRFFVECRSSSGVYFDGDNGSYIFITRGFYGENKKCLIEVLSGVEDKDDYNCEFTKAELSIDTYNKVKSLDNRKLMNQCKIQEKQKDIDNPIEEDNNDNELEIDKEKKDLK